VKKSQRYVRHDRAPAALWIFLFLLSLTEAQGQAIRSLAKVGHIRTASFDIYYAESLTDQAARLGTFADVCLDDLESFFGFAPLKNRIPVLLSDIQADLNGYSMPYPSNRIVLYLNGAGVGNELSSLEDELYSVFLHELTHTVTLNARSSFWKAAAVVAGDLMAPTAWIVPNAFLEGTAVWVESREWPLSGKAAGHGALMENPAANAVENARGNAVAPLPGRLNDPAALEPVFLDIGRGTRSSLWDVSGVADYPGSGSMPYLYGGLFAQYMTERYDPLIIPELWRMASKGNIFAGFDGTLTSGGILGEITGEPPAALWDDFLAWVGKAAQEDGGKADPGIGAAGGRVGAFTTDDVKLYYIDLERQAAFSLDLAAIEVENRQQKPTFLFPADGAIDTMSISGDGELLKMDWLRQGSEGEMLPAVYSYSIEKKALTLTGDRLVESAGAAMKNLADPTAQPFLHGARKDVLSGYTYGLAKLGSRSLPARKTDEGRIEILDSPLLFIRSLSPKWRRSLEHGDLKIALSAILPGGISRLAILEERADGWSLFLQKAAPEGGVHNPVLTQRGNVIYMADLGGGRQELRMTSVDPESISTSFERLDSTWKSLDEMRRSIGSPGQGPGDMTTSTAAAGDVTTSTVDAAEKITYLRPTLFPRIFATSRYPYADTKSAGLVFEGSDLTERLAWTSSAGWNFAAATPEASIVLDLSINEHTLSLAVADRALPASGSTPAARLSGISFSHFFYRILMPVYSYVYTNATANLTGIQSDYALADYFLPAFGYISIGGDLTLGYSSMRKMPFAPFNLRGMSVAGNADYESLPGIADAFSFSGSLGAALPKPALKVSLSGSISLSDLLRFRPAGRYFSVSNTTYPSALAASYPEYKEYHALSDGSPWYFFGEAKMRLANLETVATMKPIRMPILPSWTLRRVGLWAGLRAAALESIGALAFPASAFAQVEFDIAVLAGLAAEGHVSVKFEGAWAFFPSMAGGNAFLFDFGLGAAL